MEAEEQRFYEKIAKLDLAGVIVGEIAKVVGKSESTIYEVQKEADYLHVRASIGAAEIEKQELIGDAWDVIQAKALKIVNDNLDWNGDPDYALKAAAIANKADKPGKRFGRQIDATQAAHAVISLNVTYVEKLQEAGGQVIEHQPVMNGKKITDVLNIEKTEELLKPALEADDDASQELDSAIGKLFYAEMQ